MLGVWSLKLESRNEDPCCIPPVSPSLVLTLNQFDERRTFTLAAVVHLGGAHFTVRWRDHSGVWWKHDGHERHGSPVVDAYVNLSIPHI